MDKCYNEFIKMLPSSSLSENNCVSAESVIIEKNLKVCRTSAVVFFFLNIYYLISDLLRDFYSTPHALPNLVAILLMIISSFYIFMISLKKQRDYNNNFTNVSMLIYYLCITLSTMIFLCTFDIRAVEADVSFEFMGITLSTCYLLLFTLAPLTRLVDSIILMAAIIAGVLIPAFIPGSQAFGMFAQISFRAVVVIGYFYFRHQNKELALREIKIKELNNILLKTSYTDNLTGTLNRNALDHFFNYLTECDNINTVGIIMLDIDNFKIYNDMYSHQKGDETLKYMCEIITDNLEIDSPYLFRFGGEEFIVLAANKTDDELVELGRRFRNAVYEAGIARNDNSQFSRITISVGCAQMDIKNGVPEDYITKVDSQLYLCKHNGKNCVAINDTVIN